MQRISDQDIMPFEPKRAWNKKVSFVDEAASSDSDEEPVIGLAEWVKNKKPMSCPFGHKEPEKFAFDITKADRIFDFLLQEGQIKLSPMSQNRPNYKSSSTEMIVKQSSF